MPSSKIKNEEFGKSYEDFVSSNNPVFHRKAIEKMLGMVGLGSKFKRFLKFGTKIIEDIYCNFANNVEEDWVKEGEKEPIRKIGALFKKFYEKGDYLNFVDTGYMMIFRNLVDFLELRKRKDFDKLTDDYLFKKSLLPKDIFLQYFLIETMVKNKSFSWNRNLKIIDQNLICFDVCFTDIYAFFNRE